MIHTKPQTTLEECYFSTIEIGAIWNKEEKACHFSVWAPNATSMQVAIENKNKTYNLQPDKFGYWKNTIHEVAPGDKYYFVIDGSSKKPDPSSRFQPEGVHGPGEVIDPHFAWNDQGWKGRPLKDMIVYELHTGTFTPGGTFEAITEKLDYLIDLGINTIELLPIAQFPGDRNWGYDGVCLFAVQNSYGRPENLKRLVDACHRKGLAILLDVVYNHLGPEGNYLEDFGPYFTQKYQTPWGKAINYDDQHSHGVRNFVVQNALMWLDEYHFDGLRLDAVHAIYDFGANHIMKVLHEHVAHLEEKNQRRYVLIAESDLNDVRYISAAEKGGYGLTGQWCDDFHHAVHTLVTRENDGYYADFGSIDHMAKTLKHSFIFNGIYSPSRKRFYGNNADERPYSQFVVCIQNHDQVGNRMEGDRLSQIVSFEKLKLSAAVLLLSPHVPMLFMGEEYAEHNPFQYFISHGDEALIEAVRKGRTEEFSSFKWKGDVPDPQDRGTFDRSKLSWGYESNKKQKTMLKFYQFLISLRKNHPALQSPDRSSTSVFPEADKELIILQRSHQGKTIFMIYNFSDENQFFTIRHSSGLLEKVFDSSDEKWLGQGGHLPDEVAPDTRHIINKSSAAAFELKAH